ncbi:MAG TPA: sigma-54 dependent transcriptional regulator [Albitalea sp.]|uniref:sigma-54-dependent transcriptional regulator n=1 Tax=Piscinibacter sp. TaxID=1903157 RepID=UPI002ED2B5A4
MTATRSICLVEDDELLGETLCERFRIDGLAFDWYRGGRDALIALECRHYAAVLCDLRLPDTSGQAIFESLDTMGRPPFVFMTGFGSIDEAVALLKAGAVDFVTKPFDLDQLMLRMHRLCGDDLSSEEAPVLGISPSMRKIEALLARLEDSVEPVLITGESGVGKEVVARLLHDRSSEQRPGEWIVVNCAAIPEGLIEAELFGYVKGAFTGAVRQHRGFIEQANGGTLFLDEIGDMPLPMQTRLLRVLQERKITRIGAESPTPVDFRLICATHRDLAAMVRVGQFREDLYYRINVIGINVPPLRDRREDILWLADRMLSELPRRAKASAPQLSLAAQQALYASAWPGNARELNHVLRRAVALSSSQTLDTIDLFGEAAPDKSADASRTVEEVPKSLSDHLETSERAFLIATLRDFGGAVGEAATRLGISRKTLWEKMKRHGIDRRQIAS